MFLTSAMVCFCRARRIAERGCSTRQPPGMNAGRLHDATAGYTGGVRKRNLGALADSGNASSLSQRVRPFLYQFRTRSHHNWRPRFRTRRI